MFVSLAVRVESDRLFVGYNPIFMQCGRRFFRINSISLHLEHLGKITECSIHLTSDLPLHALQLILDILTVFLLLNWPQLKNLLRQLLILEIQRFQVSLAFQLLVTSCHLLLTYIQSSIDLLLYAYSPLIHLLLATLACIDELLLDCPDTTDLVVLDGFNLFEHLTLGLFQTLVQA